jgi:hypothetical protein
MFSKNYLLLTLIFLVSHVTYSKEFLPPSHPFHMGLTSTKKPTSKGFNIKMSPALFWRTLVIEAELPLNPYFSVGLNILGKLGGTDAKHTKEQNEAYYQPGIGAELALKFYFKGEAPEGLYLQLNGGYSTLFYQDGNTRPYTLHNHWRKQDGSVFKKPLPYYAGIGAGYQLILLPDHLIANIMVGVQGNIYDNNSFPLSLYISPSIGYKF